jgi:hypothetical protein
MWNKDGDYPVPIGFCVRGNLAGGDVVPWGPPFRWGGQFLGITAVLKTASTAGSVVIDIEKSSDNGATWASVLSTPVTIEQDEHTTLTATNQPVFSAETFDENDMFRLNITNAGTNAADLTLALWIVATGKA